MKIPILHELNLIKNQIKRLIDTYRPQENAAVIRQMLLYGNNEIFRNHLAHLGEAKTVQEEEISYHLRYTARNLRFEEPARLGSDTVVCVVAVGETYRQKVGSCLKSQEAYCRDQGYAYAELRLAPNGKERPLSWYKIPLIYSLLKAGWERVWVVDADVLITNPAIRLEPFFIELETRQKAMLLTEDDSGINCGVFFVRNCPAMIRLLDLIWLHDTDVDHGHWEQKALRTLLNHYGAIQELLAISSDAKAFNSFPSERTSLISDVHYQANTWTPGDFLCHFSGFRGRDLETIVQTYSKAYAPSLIGHSVPSLLLRNG